MQTTKEDVKYVPLESIGFKSNYDRYYQITAIDLYSQKRILKPVVERSHKIDNELFYSKRRFRSESVSILCFGAGVASIFFSFGVSNKKLFSFLSASSCSVSPVSSPFQVR